MEGISSQAYPNSAVVEEEEEEEAQHTQGWVSLDQVQISLTFPSVAGVTEHTIWWLQITHSRCSESRKGTKVTHRDTDRQTDRH